MRNESIYSGILFMLQLQPVLYWLHKDVPAQSAPGYFRALHELVYFWPADYHDPHATLVDGTECLLRIFCFRKSFVSCQKKGYCWNKFRYAASKYNEYFENLGNPLFPKELTIEEMDHSPFQDLMRPLCLRFRQWDARMAKVHSEHAEWVSFVNALLAHLDQLEAAGQILEIRAGVQGPVYKLISGLLGRGIRYNLPKELGKETTDLSSLCEKIWVDSFANQD